MSERELGDEDLLEAMRSGNEEAFVELYRRWQAPIFRFALQMIGSREAAEDVTQEVFMLLIRGGGGYQASRGSFGAWLYGMARHVILRAIAREKPVRASLDAPEGEVQVKNLRSPCSDPHDDTVRREETELLRSAVLSLPVHYREVLVLCELHEMNYAEAARTLGCNIGTIRSRLHRARSMLAERLRWGEFEPARPLRTIAPDGYAV